MDVLEDTVPSQIFKDPTNTEGEIICYQYLRCNSFGRSQKFCPSWSRESIMPGVSVLPVHCGCYISILGSESTAVSSCRMSEFRVKLMSPSQSRAWRVNSQKSNHHIWSHWFKSCHVMGCSQSLSKSSSIPRVLQQMSFGVMNLNEHF